MTEEQKQEWMQQQKDESTLQSHYFNQLLPKNNECKMLYWQVKKSQLTFTIKIKWILSYLISFFLYDTGAIQCGASISIMSQGK